MREEMGSGRGTQGSWAALGARGSKIRTRKNSRGNAAKRPSRASGLVSQAAQSRRHSRRCHVTRSSKPARPWPPPPRGLCAEQPPAGRRIVPTAAATVQLVGSMLLLEVPPLVASRGLPSGGRLVAWRCLSRALKGPPRRAGSGCSARVRALRSGLAWSETGHSRTASGRVSLGMRRATHTQPVAQVGYLVAASAVRGPLVAARWPPESQVHWQT